MKRMFAKSLSGSVKRMESETELSVTERGTYLKNRAEIVPDSTIAQIVGVPFVRHEIEQQFSQMLSEMIRRESTAVLGSSGRNVLPID